MKKLTHTAAIGLRYSYSKQLLLLNRMESWNWPISVLLERLASQFVATRLKWLLCGIDLRTCCSAPNCTRRPSICGQLAASSLNSPTQDGPCFQVATSMTSWNAFSNCWARRWRRRGRQFRSYPTINRLPCTSRRPRSLRWCPSWTHGVRIYCRNFSSAIQPYGPRPKTVCVTRTLLTCRRWRKTCENHRTDDEEEYVTDLCTCPVLIPSSLLLIHLGSIPYPACTHFPF